MVYGSESGVCEDNRGVGGDCPSGCIHEEFTYFTYDPASGVVTQDGYLSAESPRSGQIALYGIPDRFPLRPFTDFSDLLAHASDKQWWVALHSVTAICMPLNGPAGPWVGEDFEPPGHFDSFRDATEVRRSEVYEVLLEALAYPDDAVRTSARMGLAV